MPDVAITTRTNGQNGRTDSPSERAAESGARMSFDARPWPSKRGSISVCTNAITPDRW
jgi:hypothetical protein